MLPNRKFQAGSLTGPELGLTTSFTASAPNGLSAGQPISFVAAHLSTAGGLTVRVQVSKTPLVERSRTTLPGGIMQNAGGGKWTLTTDGSRVSADASRPYFYRALAAAQGYHDSASM